MVKTPALYGTKVFHHLTAIRTNLMKDSPKRNGWLQLIKDLVDYVNTSGRV